MAATASTTTSGVQAPAAGALELASVAALGIAAALAVIVLVAPTARVSPDAITTPNGLRGGAAPAAAISLASLEGDLFHRAGVARGDAAGDAASLTAPETTLNLVLKGVRAGEDAASAIIQTPDNLDGRFLVGDTIVPGVILAEVRDDRVILDRAGAREQLLFARETLLIAAAADALAASAPSASVADAAALAADIDSLFSTLELRPVRADDALIGYAIAAAYDQALLGRVGLATGDVVVEVAGRNVASGLSVGDLFEQLRGEASVEIVVERAGVRTPITIEFTPGGE